MGDYNSQITQSKGNKLTSVHHVDIVICLLLHLPTHPFFRVVFTDLSSLSVADRFGSL